MKWIKQGLLFDPSGGGDWFASHAALPVPEHLDGDRYRVYFAARDAHGRAHIGYCAVRLADQSVCESVSASPVLSPGPVGAFDDSGVTTSCLVSYGGRKFLYYTGWSLGVTVPFYLFAGLAVSDDDGRTFNRLSIAPLLDRDAGDPFLSASPFVRIEGGLWRMWYISGDRWEVEDGHPKHYYRVKYAESRNGLAWRRYKHVCIDFESPDEYAIGRPWVVRDPGLYRMWYAVRGRAYRIGYAESVDGLSWSRKDDEVGIDPSQSGWDSEMIEYPSVVDQNGRRYMLYNGNGYGRSGFGLAVCAQTI